jgi:hypothetical protein
MFDKNLRWRWFAGLTASLLSLTGCGDEDEQARVRFIHASPDVPAVDVYASEREQPLFTNVTYGMSTEEIDYPASTLTLQLRPAGGGSELPPLVSGQPYALEENAQISFVAAGARGASTSEESSRILPIRESFTPPAPGRFRVRFLHAGTDAPTLDIDVDGNGTAEVRELERFTDSGEAGLELPAQTSLRFQVRSEDPRTEALGFTLPPLPEDSRVLVVLTGLVSLAPRMETGVSLVVAGTEGLRALIRPDPVVYVLNASEEAGPLDIFLASEERASELGFGALSPPILVHPGVAPLDVFPAAPTSRRPGVPALLSQSTAELESGERYLLVATGIPGSPENDRSAFVMTPYAEAFAPDSAQARLRFIHASVSTPVVDAAPLDGNPLLPVEVPFNDVAYTQTSAPEGAPIPSIDLALGVRPADQDTGAAPTRFEIVPAPVPGEGLFGVLAGTFRGGDASQLRLLLVSTTATPWSVEVSTPNSAGGRGEGGSPGRRVSPRSGPTPVIPELSHSILAEP